MPSVFPNEKVFDVQEKNSNVTNSVTKKKGLIIEKKYCLSFIIEKKCVSSEKGARTQVPSSDKNKQTKYTTFSSIL